MNRNTQEFSPLPEEFHAPAAELAPPPAEYAPQTRQPDAPTGKRRRKLRFLVFAAAALVMTGLLFAPKEAAERTPGGQDGPGVETGTNPGGPAAGEPEDDSPLLGIQYAAVRPEEPGVVHYGYTALPSPYTDRVDAYVTVTDESGREARAFAWPDEWLYSRDRIDYTLDASGLEGAMTLTVRAVYTVDGVEKEASVSSPVAVLPPEPDLGAELVLGASGIGYRAWFVPLKEDEHVYDLEITDFSLCFYDAEGAMVLGSGVAEDGSLPSMEAEYRGWTFRYGGGAMIYLGADRADSFSVVLELVDRSTGYPYRIETALQPFPAAEEPDDGLPHADVVFFNCSALHYGLLQFRHPELIESVSFSMRETHLDRVVLEGGPSAEEIAGGSWTLPSLNGNKLVTDNWDAFEHGEIEPEIELTVTVRGTDGSTETTVTMPSPELGWSMRVISPEVAEWFDYINVPAPYIALSTYESFDAEPLLTLNRPGDVAFGAIDLELTVDGVPYDGKAIFQTHGFSAGPPDEDGVFHMWYEAWLIIPIEGNLPEHATVHWTVTQRLENAGIDWVREGTFEY